ncbi:hypothetical protein, variant 2 [Aphanomyces astaci]|uniref:Uncharacterized protein n=1 Tax=Aphanomyces astaci TaxID=112090 RepID=W4FRA0_APHAT|nr:hypothetical protein, variant 1 [Aphanomyces astaci]XP_009841201.1 hypothetical protein, variant 2 [Aphanomyces astaci]ETV69343.1 hypothetical protein, variant 1 [Aphanomyces astaci]ETV69344.1 hypothetical protein, variant 2 [Aphanomyces astaci]|eukprot:XP_009841200.1 hypothetical protein, variant 1 [Aphanomyces astaci]
MVIAKAVDGGGGGSDRLCTNVALMRELLIKEDDASIVVKPPHKVVPPYDNDDQQEESQRRSISKRVKRAMLAFAHASSSARRQATSHSSRSPSLSDVASTDTTSDALMEVFSSHDPRNRERRLFRIHLHVPDGGTVSYMKFIAHVFDHHAKPTSPSPSSSSTQHYHHLLQENDHGPRVPLSPHLPLLHSTSAASLDLNDIARTRRRQQSDLMCTKQFLQQIVKQACVEATLWHVNIPQVLRRAMHSQPLDIDDDVVLHNDTSSQISLDQAQFFVAMYVSFNVHAARDADACRIFHHLQKPDAIGTPPPSVTLSDLLDALVRFGLLKQRTSTPTTTSTTPTSTSTTQPPPLTLSTLPSLVGGFG